MSCVEASILRQYAMIFIAQASAETIRAEAAHHRGNALDGKDENQWRVLDKYNYQDSAGIGHLAHGR